MPTIHKVEEELRARGAGVYGDLKARSAPKNKMADAPKNKTDDLPALSGLTKDELIAQAEKEGVDLSEASNNDERREAIEKARG